MNTEQTKPEYWATCLECEWSGNVKECETEVDYDEFWGHDHHFPICPECEGGVEVDRITPEEDD